MYSLDTYFAYVKLILKAQLGDITNSDETILTNQQEYKYYHPVVHLSGLLPPQLLAENFAYGRMIMTRGKCF